MEAYYVKISMRFSITSIVLFLLLTMSTLVVCFGYFALQKTLIAAATNSMRYETEKACQQINDYFSPLSTVSNQAFELLNSDIIKPKYSEKMMRFLHAVNKGNENLGGAFWWNTFEDFFYVYKPEERNGIEETLIFDKNHGNKTIQKFYDNNQNLIKTERINKAMIYKKPWRQLILDKKQTVSVMFYFAQIGSQQIQPGLVTARPFYNSNGKLLGIFGVDMLFSAISRYINNIKITKNSLVFIIDSTGKTIDNLHDNKSSIHTTEINLALKEKSFAVYNKEHKSPFVFVFNDKKYISTYEQISGLQTENMWFVSIITPISDVTGPLHKNILIELIMIIMVMPIGLLLTSIFSSNISRPIKNLAQSANLICKLKLDEIKTVFSIIKEIAEMNDSFTQMKNALASFQRYMPVALIKKLIASNNVATVGGENKELTLMFTDIENFTKLSENIEPQHLMQYLSRYFQIITKIIIDTNGTVDKYMGDSVMAFWGAPIEDKDHALHACQAAIKIQESLKQFNEENKRHGNPLLVTRIGINTGSVVVGNVGSDDRLNYTSLGDHVNLASRLEGLNKVYKTAIIVSEHTHDRVKNDFKLIFLDKAMVKGKQNMVRIYELLDYKESNPNISVEKYNQAFTTAFYNYEKRNWQIAIELFNDLNKKYPNNYVIQVFIKRCLFFMNNPPPQDWNGVWTMGEK